LYAGFLVQKFSDGVYNKYRNMCHKSISGAEMSKTLWHWCQSVLDFYGREMSNGHFGTSAEMSWSEVS